MTSNSSTCLLNCQLCMPSFGMMNRSQIDPWLSCFRAPRAHYVRVDELNHKEGIYNTLLTRCRALLHGETDLITAMSTIACELHAGVPWFDWTGFYRVVQPGLLKVGPYQGGHGCLTIPFERGVCGRCAREAKVQLVPDVRDLPYHIACSSDTLSEVVVPVFDAAGKVRAVLDVDSNTLAAFDRVDSCHLQEVCRWLTPLYG